MHTVRRSVLLPYAVEGMFELVADVEQYPRFLPWCAQADVLERDDQGTLARLRIAFAGVSQSFTTRNTHAAPTSISMALHDGPFSALAGQWQFVPLAADACRVEFVLQYAFSSRLVERAIGPVFDQIAQSFVDAFVRRAEQLDGR